MSCPRLIARDAELAQLRSGLAAAAGGTPRTVFVVGEAGVGKTRLVREFADQARDEGVRVWTGGCLPLADGFLPYAPVVDILRAAVADVGAARLRELAGAAAARLALLVPELAPEPDVAGTRMGVAAEQPESGHVRLNAELRYLLERLADDPTVLVVEDVHWADTSTQGLLSVLIHGQRRGRMLLVCTYRDDELPAASPLRALLAELTQRGTDRVALGRLNRAGTSAQLAGILQTEPDPALAERVYARSGGNPFLAEELVAAGADATTLPQTLRDILLMRARRLSAAAQRVLRVVALSGRGADHGLLEAVTGVPAGELIAAVGEAVQRHLLVHDADRYVFRHALVAEAVVADTVPGERTGLHRAIAETLAARLSSGDRGRDTGVTPSAVASARAEVAYHWFAARDAGRALVASCQAGLAAEDAFALPEARSQYERALGLWWEAPSARAEAPLDLVELYRRAGEMAYMLGDCDAALAVVRRGIAAADALREPRRAGILHERLGRYLLVSASSEAATIAAYQTAVDLVPEKPTPERARVLGGLASALIMAGRHAQSQPWAQRALEVAKRAGAGPEEAHALSTLGTGLTMLGEPDRGLAIVREAFAVAVQFEHLEDMHRVYADLSDCLVASGRFAEAAEVATRGIRESQTLCGVETAEGRDVVDTFGNCLLGNAMEALFWLGRWDEITVPERPRGTGNAAQDVNPWFASAALRTAQGRFDEAQRYVHAIQAALVTGGVAELRGMAQVVSAELSLWRGEPASALETVGRALDALATSDHLPLVARLLAAGARAQADLGHAAKPRTGGVAEDPRLPHLVEAISDRSAGLPFAEAHLAVAQAELARSRGDQTAPAAWGRAAYLWDHIRGPYLQAYARWRQAEAFLVTSDQRRAATRALTQAYTIAARLGAAALRTETEALARRRRIELTPRVGGARDAAPEQYSALGLTGREEQVLHLLAEGSTNRQIARTLFISEKTVSIHVSRILAKLSVPNRAAAAAVAHRLGLVSAPAKAPAPPS